MRQWIQKLLGPTHAAGDQKALLPWETELKINHLVQEQKRWMDVGFDCVCSDTEKELGVSRNQISVTALRSSDKTKMINSLTDYSADPPAQGTPSEVILQCG